MSSLRQLAAVMFTDMAGYTTLMGEDEQKAISLLQQNRKLQKPLIEQFKGTWIKELGDGVLATFPTATDAVQCAIAIQNACNSIDFNLRIGIHLADIVFENHDVFGDGVNIASRIQAIAPVGGIWVSEPVYSSVVNKKDINIRFIRSENLRHVREPVRIYEIVLLNMNPQPESDPAPGRPAEKTLAVLPFADMSQAHDQEYLGDGLAEELLNILAQVKGLKVIGRTSSFSFKNKDADLKTIGKLLGADTIVEGSVQRSGNRVRITAQLINASDGYHIWSQRYNRDMDDIFALQDEICANIADNLKLTLLPVQETRQENRPTRNLQAYENYLKGDFHYKKYTPEGFQKSMGFFQKAVELDPLYADAWCYLGLANFEQHMWLYFRKDKIQTVLDCIERTLAINATHADVHYLKALVHFNYDNDWERTVSEIALGNQYKKAIPLLFLPLEAWVRATLFDEFEFAVRHIQKGMELDPLNIACLFHLSLINLICFRDYNRTRALLQETLDLGFPEEGTWRPFCLSLLFEGRYEEAEEYARKDYEACQGKGHGAANLIISLAASGKKEEAEHLYRSVKEILPIAEFPFFLHVRVNAWLGKINEAFDYLDQAIRENSYWLFSLKVSPEWDPIRSDPRFEQVLKRLKFPGY